MAQADLIQIANYWIDASGDDVAAYSVVAKLDAQCKKLAGLPGALGRPRNDLHDGLRTFPVASYVLVFKYLGDETLEVARILNAKRDIAALYGKTSRS